MRRRAFALVLLTSFAASVTSCVEVREPALPIGAPLDGESIFRGLVFGEGEVAQLFPEIWAQIRAEDPNWTVEQRQRVRDAKAILIADMRASEPTFFDDFHAAMTSGNHVRITRTLDRSVALFRKVVEARGGQEIRTGGDPGACLAGPVAIAVAAIEVVGVYLLVTVAGVANIAVYANAVYEVNVFWPATEPVHDQGGASTTGTNRPRLQRDEAVHLIALRLKGR